MESTGEVWWKDAGDVGGLSGGHYGESAGLGGWAAAVGGACLDERREALLELLVGLPVLVGKAHAVEAAEG